MFKRYIKRLLVEVLNGKAEDRRYLNMLEATDHYNQYQRTEIRKAVRAAVEEMFDGWTPSEVERTSRNLSNKVLDIESKVDTALARIGSEQFIDAVVERIRKKQV
jgi:hypothetical protein